MIRQIERAVKSVGVIVACHLWCLCHAYWPRMAGLTLVCCSWYNHHALRVSSFVWSPGPMVLCHVCATGLTGRAGRVVTCSWSVGARFLEHRCVPCLFKSWSKPGNWTKNLPRTPDLHTRTNSFGFWASPLSVVQFHDLFLWWARVSEKQWSDRNFAGWSWWAGRCTTPQVSRGRSWLLCSSEFGSSAQLGKPSHSCSSGTKTLRKSASPRNLSTRLGSTSSSSLCFCFVLLVQCFCTC